MTFQDEEIIRDALIQARQAGVDVSEATRRLNCEIQRLSYERVR